MSNCSCADKKDIYLPILATVSKQELLNDTEMYLHLNLDTGEPLGHSAGQFIEVSVAGLGEAPISITSSPTQKGFELVVRNVGSVTNAIHNLKAGDKLGIRGPFGTGYGIDELKGKDIVFICGGIGLVPQRSLINYVLHNRSDFGEVTILQGTKDYTQRFFKDELAAWYDRKDITMLETIDDTHPDWSGNVGVVTTLIPKIKTDLTNAMILVCGPPIMYKFVMMSMKEAGVPEENIFVNLERRMKCGVGKCGHCQMNGQYVCQSGPVYRFSDLENIPEAI
jgi:sulfhydrogenase subunit gamma (sulfur reductase)